MVIDRNDLQPYELDWAVGRTRIGPNLKKVYETFVCTVELALKQLYTYLANGVHQEKNISLFTLISK